MFSFVKREWKIQICRIRSHWSAPSKWHSDQIPRTRVWMIIISRRLRHALVRKGTFRFGLAFFLLLRLIWTASARRSWTIAFFWGRCLLSPLRWLVFAFLNFSCRIAWNFTFLKLFDLPSHGRIPVVFDSIIGTPWQQLCNFSPSVAQPFVGLQDYLVFFLCPRTFANVWV